MTAFEFGDVVLVKFPFTNLQTTKQRPAVVISNAEYQQHNDIILMAITSQLREPLSFGEYILQDWQQSGLLKPSVLKPLVATLEQNQIIRTLGKLSATDQSSLQAVLQKIIG